MPTGEAPRNYENQEQMYPLTKALKAVPLSDLKGNQTAIEAYEKKGEPHTMYEALKMMVAVPDAADASKTDAKATEQAIRAILGRARAAGFNVSLVRAGDKFSIDSGMLKIERADERKYIISLTDATATDDGDYKAINKRGDIPKANEGERVWRSKGEVLDLQRGILYDAMRSHGYGFTPESLGNLWREISDNKDFLGSSLAKKADKVDLNKEYKGTSQQNLLIIRYLKEWRTTQRELKREGPVDIAPIKIKEVSDPLAGLKEVRPIPTVEMLRREFKVDSIDPKHPKDDDVFITPNKGFVKISFSGAGDTVAAFSWDDLTCEFKRDSTISVKKSDLQKPQRPEVQLLIENAQAAREQEEVRVRELASKNAEAFEQARLAGEFKTTGEAIRVVSRKLGAFVEVGKTAASQRVAILGQTDQHYMIVTKFGMKGLVDKQSIGKETIRPK